MSLFSKLFGGSEKTETEPEIYDGFRIFPDPIKEANGYRIAARIESGEGDTIRTHQLIRADTCTALDEATAMSLAKAKQVIDEQGEGIFS